MAESLEKSSSVYYIRQKEKGTHAHNYNLPISIPIHYTEDLMIDITIFNGTFVNIFLTPQGDARPCQFCRMGMKLAEDHIHIRLNSH